MTNHRGEQNVRDARETSVVQVILKVQMVWASSSSEFEKLQEKKLFHCKYSIVDALCPFPTCFKLPNCVMPLLRCSIESNNFFGGDQSDQTENLLPSFPVSSKETLDWSWVSVEVGPLMMQISMQSTFAFSHLSPWNKQFNFPAKAVLKWEAYKDLLLSEEWDFIKVDANHLHLSFSCYCCYSQGGMLFIYYFFYALQQSGE